MDCVAAQLIPMILTWSQYSMEIRAESSDIRHIVGRSFEGIDGPNRLTSKRNRRELAPGGNKLQLKLGPPRAKDHDLLSEVEA